MVNVRDSQTPIIFCLTNGMHAAGIGGMPLKRLAHPMRVRQRVNSVYTERVVVQL